MQQNKISGWWMILGMAISACVEFFFATKINFGTEAVYASGLVFVLLAYVIAIIFLKRVGNDKKFDLLNGQKFVKLSICFFLAASYATFGWIFCDLLIFFWRGYGNI